MPIEQFLAHINATDRLHLTPDDLTPAYPMSIAPAREGRYAVASSERDAVWTSAFYRDGGWHGVTPVPANGVWRGLRAPVQPDEEEPLDVWARRTLGAMRERALSGLRDLRGDSVAADSRGGDEADRAASYAQNETTLAAADVLSQRLAEIDAALARLDAGQYGICPVTEEEIPRARLRANPLALYAVEHQARLEALDRLRRAA
jgi:RNA polymerase-binding transcription factor DksA